MGLKSNSRFKINILGLKLSFINPFCSVNNKVILVKNGKKYRKYFYPANIKFYGSNNCVEFYEKIPKLKNVKIELGNNSAIKIHESQYTIKNLKINARADNVLVDIGKDFSSESCSIDFHGEPNVHVVIGDDCQFGCDIEIDTADGHTIFNEQGNVINKPQNIMIGNHVWLCKNVSVLKGVVIPDNCVAAKGSILTKQYTDINRVIAGIPAKQKDGYITWSRKANKDFI